MRHCLIIFLSIIISIPLAGSDLSVIDSYRQKIKEIKEHSDGLYRDSMLVWRYGHLCDELARIQDDGTLSCLDTLELLSNSSTWPNALGIYYRGVGRYHDFKGEHDRAIEYYDKAIEALKPGHGDLKELAFAYVLKGFLLSNSELPQECKRVLHEGLPYAKQAKSKNSLCFILDWMGDYYYYGLADTVDYEKALYYYKEVEKILPEISYMRIISDNHAVLSGCYERLGYIKQSDYHFKMADSLSDAHGLIFVKRGLYAQKARLLDEHGKYRQANKIYQQIAEFLDGNKNIEFQARAEKDLWQSYKNIGDYELAMSHFEKWKWMEDSLANQQIALKYTELEKKYDLAKKENEIALLERQKSSDKIKYLLILGALCFMGLIIIMRKNRALEKSRKALILSYKKTEEAIYRGEQKERSRIASALHDGVNSKIAAIKWQLESIEEDDESNQQILDDTISMIESTYQEVRQISHNLIPQELEDAGLEKAITSLLEKLNQNGDIKFEIVCRQNVSSLLKSKMYPVYNITLELINNIIRHAEASSAKVIIEKKEGNMSLIIEDDGRGYNQSKESGGFGLKSIRERVNSLRGRLNIRSIINEGTKVEILIPV